MFFLIHFVEKFVAQTGSRPVSPPGGEFGRTHLNCFGGGLSRFVGGWGPASTVTGAEENAGHRVAHPPETRLEE
jgi:hypothetical protein